jgi:hypothetical protein
MTSSDMLQRTGRSGLGGKGLVLIGLDDADARAADDGDMPLLLATIHHRGGDVLELAQDARGA